MYNSDGSAHAVVELGYGSLNIMTQSVLLALKGFRCAVDWDGPTLVEITKVDSTKAAGTLYVTHVLEDGSLSTDPDDTAVCVLGDPDSDGLVVDVLIAFITSIKPSIVYANPTQIRRNA